MNDSTTGMLKKSEMERLMQSLSYETLEMVFVSSREELEIRLFNGETQ